MRPPLPRASYALGARCERGCAARTEVRHPSQPSNPSKNMFSSTIPGGHHLLIPDREQPVHGGDPVASTIAARETKLGLGAAPVLTPPRVKPDRPNSRPAVGTDFIIMTVRSTPGGTRRPGSIPGGVRGAHTSSGLRPPRNLSLSLACALVTKTTSISPSPERQRARPRSSDSVRAVRIAAKQHGPRDVTRRCAPATHASRSLSRQSQVPFRCISALSAPDSHATSRLFFSPPHHRRHTTRPYASWRDPPASATGSADLGVAQRACDFKIHGKSTQARRRQHRSHKILPRRRFPPKLKLRADVCGSEERPAGGVQGVIRRSRTARADRVFRLDMSIFDIRNVTGRANYNSPITLVTNGS